MSSAAPILDRVAMNTLFAANKRQAAVTKDLRQREAALAELVKLVAEELRSCVPSQARCAELATQLLRIRRLTTKPTRLIQKAAEKAARI